MHFSYHKLHFSAKRLILFIGVLCLSVGVDVGCKEDSASNRDLVLAFASLGVPETEYKIKVATDKPNADFRVSAIITPEPVAYQAMGYQPTVTSDSSGSIATETSFAGSRGSFSFASDADVFHAIVERTGKTDPECTIVRTSGEISIRECTVTIIIRTNPTTGGTGCSGTINGIRCDWCFDYRYPIFGDASSHPAYCPGNRPYKCTFQFAQGTGNCYSSSSACASNTPCEDPF